MKLSQPVVGTVNKSCMIILMHPKLCLFKTNKQQQKEPQTPLNQQKGNTFVADYFSKTLLEWSKSKVFGMILLLL